MIHTHLNFRADYNMSTYEVYLEVALQSLKQYQNLEVLSYASQTAHPSQSWPSWIPRWDINSHPAPILLPFLYDAAKGANFEFSFDPDMHSLSVKGLNLDTITDTSSVIKIAKQQENEPDSSRIGKDLLAFMRLITQDQWHEDMPDESAATRATAYTLRLQLANWASHALPLLENRQEDTFVSLAHILCNVCGCTITAINGPESSKALSFHHCTICQSDDFDVCVACYGLGETCLNKNHKLSKRESAGVVLPYTPEIVQELRALATGEEPASFSPTCIVDSTQLAFFETSRGWRGVATIAMELGDVIVVLFGSRVPFVLRNHGLAYRLVSHCYLEGIMDGEAMDMWKKGELREEQFEIR
jgi:hypothetical protein